MPYPIILKRVLLGVVLTIRINFKEIVTVMRVILNAVVLVLICVFPL